MLSLLVIVLIQLAQAHGEDHPGPHGGKIQMPGAFHTEVTVLNGQAQVYLLDMNFENPTLENSSVKAFIKSDKKEALTCEKKTNHFLCQIPKGFKKGQLILEATRSGAKGNEAVYDWPLK